MKIRSFHDILLIVWTCDELICCTLQPGQIGRSGMINEVPLVGRP